jgi:hypothetical protein
MKLRLGSLFLVLVLAGSAVAGMPLHFGESDCGMNGMSDIDCCKTALLQQQTPEVADAKLCCALICSQNGTTLPQGNVRVTAPPLAHTLAHPAVARQVQIHLLPFQPNDRLHHPPGFTPVYLRNLALLI